MLTSILPALTTELPEGHRVGVKTCSSVSQITRENKDCYVSEPTVSCETVTREAAPGRSFCYTRLLEDTNTCETREIVGLPEWGTIASPNKLQTLPPDA